MEREGRVLYIYIVQAARVMELGWFFTVDIDFLLELPSGEGGSVDGGGGHPVLNSMRESRDYIVVTRASILLSRVVCWDRRTA